MTPPRTVVAAALHQAQRQGLARLDAQLLLAHLLGQRRTWLLAHDDHPLTPEQEARWADLVTRRLDAVPLAYLTGRHEFYGLDLQVGPAVLDPRPDTETLVDWALDCLRGQPPGARVLDLGTGSGAIALALARACPDAQVTGIDASPSALAIARANGERLRLPVRWAAGDWFAPLDDETFHLVVSNPPYLADDDPHLADLRHEPREALCAGPDGLDDLRHLAVAAPQHLVPGGWLLLEHGQDQGDTVAALLHTHGFVDIAHRRDLAGHTRCTGGRLPDLREQG